MPVPWVALPAAILLTPANGASIATASQHISADLSLSALHYPLPTTHHPLHPSSDAQHPIPNTYQVGDLIVEAKSATFTKEKVTFTSGVRATFADEILTADSLILYPQDEKGEASGNVVLTDPAGTLSAQDLTFSWKPGAKGGNASNIHLEMAGVMIDAASAESIPGDPPTLRFTGVYGTSCSRERTPLYAIRSPEVVFHPGKDGAIRHPILYLFGHRIATLPTHHFTLDPRIHGVPLPGLAVGSGGKLGIKWGPSWLLDDQTAISANVRSFNGQLFTADAYVTRSYIDPQKSTSLITPHSDLSERFGGGYFDNIRVESPLEQVKSEQAFRRTLSFGTVWNKDSINDPEGEPYSKLLEGVYEVGGPMGNMGYQASLRAQDIKQGEGDFKGRLVGQGAVGLPPLKVANNLYEKSRIDMAVYLGSEVSGWARAEAGIYAVPAKWLTLGVAYAHGEDWGGATFQADKLLIRDVAMARADLNFGPTKISYLVKRDFDRDKWYREYMVSQVMGCLQVFVMSRQFPRSYQLGITLRLEEFLGLLRSRKLDLKNQTQGPSTQAPASHAHGT